MESEPPTETAQIGESEMKFTFVYVGYTYSMCADFIKEITEILKKENIFCHYDEQRMTLETGNVELVVYPVSCGSIVTLLNASDADYICTITAYPPYYDSEKIVKITDIIRNKIMPRFRKEPKAIDERTMKDYISLLIDIERKTVNAFSVPNIQPDKVETCEFPEWSCQYNQEPIERGVENEKNT